MSNKASYFILLLLTPVQLCFTPVAQTSDPRLNALMAFERETEAAAARGDLAFLDRALAHAAVLTHGLIRRSTGASAFAATSVSCATCARSQ